MEPFAILLGVISSIDTLLKIIDAIQGAFQFNELCAEIGRKTGLLLAVIDADNIKDNALSPENLPQTIAKQSSGTQKSVEHVKNTVMEIEALILKCTQSFFLQKTWEIFINRKMMRLKQELSEWIIVCMLECTVS